MRPPKIIRHVSGGVHSELDAQSCGSMNPPAHIGLQVEVTFVPMTAAQHTSPLEQLEALVHESAAPMQGEPMARHV